MARPNSLRETRARTRLLDGALVCARRDGAGQLTIQSIAVAAGVSKALVLYHFRDKEELLARLLERITCQVIDRERQAVSVSTATSVMEDVWRWLQGELEHGEIAILSELSREPGETLRTASDESLRQRLVSAEWTLGRVFDLLGLKPRVPLGLLSRVHVAFTVGLALLARQQRDANHRITFDVFWLSLLNLVE